MEPAKNLSEQKQSDLQYYATIYIYIYIYIYIQNGLTAENASMDCISPLRSEMNAAVPSAFFSWI